MVADPPVGWGRRAVVAYRFCQLLDMGLGLMAAETLMSGLVSWPSIFSRVPPSRSVVSVPASTSTPRRLGSTATPYRGPVPTSSAIPLKGLGPRRLYPPVQVYLSSQALRTTLDATETP